LVFLKAVCASFEEDRPKNALDDYRREIFRLRYFYHDILCEWLPDDMNDMCNEGVDFLEGFLPTAMTIDEESKRIKSLVVIPDKK